MAEEKSHFLSLLKQLLTVTDGISIYSDMRYAMSEFSLCHAAFPQKNSSLQSAIQLQSKFDLDLFKSVCGIYSN